jgi:hypothetical protein
MNRKLISWTTAPVIAGALLTAGILPSRAASVSIGIPTYFAPSDTADWNNIENNASKVSLVIVNPGNGPDPSQASAYQSLYATLHAKGIKVLGYVHTLAGCRPYHSNYNYTTSPDYAVSGLGVEGDINEWSKEKDVDGIFLDEGPSTGTWNNKIANFSYAGYTYSPNPSLTECSGTTLQYYQPIRAYAQSLSWPNGAVPSLTLNPGGPTDEQYLYDSAGANTQNGVADVIVTAEEYNFQVYAGNNNAWLAGQFVSGGGLYWVYSHSPSHFWQMCYGFEANDIDPVNSAINEVANSVAQAESWNAQYIYYTDSTTPYSTLPGTTVWNDELYNSAGQLAPPAGGAGSGGGTTTSFSNEKAWDDGTNFYYSASYTGSFAHFNVFLDSDLSASTGYPINGTGADYMIEDTGFYKSSTNGAWGWNSVSATVTETTPSSGTVQFSVPLSAFGSPASAKVSFQGLDANWNGTTDPTVVTFTKLPSAPTGLTATAGNAKVSLSWAAPSGAASYNVYRGTTSGGEGSAPVATGITTTSYANTGLTNGSAYYYKVAAVNSGGTSGMSNEAGATPQAATTIYNATESVSGSNVTFKFSYTGTWTYFHVFVDTDRNAATGYTIGGIGADYMIENGGLYKSTANGSGWSWSSAGSVTYSNSNGVATFTLPLSSIGSPAHMNAVYQVVSGSTSYTTGLYSY